MRIDQASASTRSAARTASAARLRTASARILAPAIRLPKMTSRDLVLMAGAITAGLAMAGNATTLRGPERAGHTTAFVNVQSVFDHNNQAAIITLFRVMNRYVGNLPAMPGVFPDYPAPVVRNAGADRELTMMRWGMPPPPRAGGFPVTNIRNTSSPHWRGWLRPESRCLVPCWLSVSFTAHLSRA